MTQRESARRWRKTVHIKHFLSDDESSENARKVAGSVAGVLKRQPEYRDGAEHDYEFADIADEFGDIADSSDGTCEDLNALLSAFYDWADGARVWVA